MGTYVVLLRGINVGGKNKVPMADLRDCIEELGYDDVTTYIASGNLIFESNTRAEEIKARIEQALPKTIQSNSELVRVRVLTRDQLQDVMDRKPKGFGEQPEKYHSDAIFLMDIDSSRALSVFAPRAGVDSVWAGDGVIYSQRISSQRTKSRLSKIMAAPEYKSMTIRSWNTVTALVAMVKNRST